MREKKDRLKKLVGASAEALPRLPLIHSTDSYTLEDILSQQCIRTQECNVFKGEELVYFFYGRPAFRANLDAEPSSLKHYFPVCLILKPDWLNAIRRIFPFDSGAFDKGLYEAHLHKRMSLEDFGLEADPSTPGRLINRFFGSIPAYLKAKPEIKPSIDAAEFEAQSYMSLIDAKDSNAIDSRGSGVELQFDTPIPIVDAVAAIVLPSTFVEGSTGHKAKSLGIDLLAYRTYERSRPNEYMSEITTICFNYYVQIKLIDEGDL